MSERSAIEVRELSKRCGDLEAVRQAFFSVEHGKRLGLLGSNGADKSTTIAMLSCLTRPTEARAWIMGHSILSEPLEVKACIGVVPQEIALYPDLSARDKLAFWGKMYGLRGAGLRGRLEEVLDRIGLESRQRGAVAKASGGVKRRVGETRKGNRRWLPHS